MSLLRAPRALRRGLSFCGSEDAIGVAPPPVRTVARLGRAAILAFGATLGAGSILSGCVALYGAPAPERDAGTPMEDAAVAPAYGAPAPDGG